MELEIFHPESPGVRTIVNRNWIQRLLYPKEFATLGEAIASSKRSLNGKGKSKEKERVGV